MDNLSKWILLDIDKNQYLKKISETKYSLIELSEFVGVNAKYVVFQDVIDLEKYSKEEIECFIENHCCCSMEDFKDYHKINHKQFLAKILFEENSPNEDTFNTEFKTKVEAIDFLLNWIKDN